MYHWSSLLLPRPGDHHHSFVFVAQSSQGTNISKEKIRRLVSFIEQTASLDRYYKSRLQQQRNEESIRIEERRRREEATKTAACGTTFSISIVLFFQTWRLNTMTMLKARRLRRFLLWNIHSNKTKRKKAFKKKKNHRNTRRKRSDDPNPFYRPSQQSAVFLGTI